MRRLTKSDAIEEHERLSILIARGRKDLATMDARELAELRQLLHERRESPRLRDAIEEFLKTKERRSSRHYDSLRGDLRLFEDYIGGDTQVGAMRQSQMQKFIDGRSAKDRRRLNLRSTLVTLFRWLRARNYLPDRKTEAESLDAIEKVPGKVHVLPPQALKVLLDNVREEYLPWLVVGAFAGIRSEEIAPDPRSRKSPLMWEDFKWTRRLIDVRAETAKTGKKHKPQRRIVPMEDALFEWLRPWHNARGRVCRRQPTKRETARLGGFIGGHWPHNCLRDSYGSYRMAIIKNMPQLAYEMNNSIAMIENCYLETQDEETARLWFSIRPETDASHSLVTLKM